MDFIEIKGMSIMNFGKNGSNRIELNAIDRLDCPLGRGLKTKSWNIKTRIAELGVFMHKFAIENDPKP